MRSTQNEGAVLTAVKTVSDLLMLAGNGIKDDEFDARAVGKAISAATGAKKSNSYSYSSVASSASKLMAIFPILTSRTVSKDTAHRVQKYIEQQGCMMLQLALQQANISGAKNGIEYLRQFHQNLNGSSNGLDALGNVLDTYAERISAQNSSADISGSRYDDMIMEAVMEALGDPSNFVSDDSIKLSPTQMNELLEMMAEGEKFNVYDTKLNPVSIQDYMVSESSNSRYHVSVRPLYEDKKTGAYSTNKEYDDDYYGDLKRNGKMSGYDIYKRNKELQGDEHQKEDRAYQMSERKRQEEERKMQIERKKHLVSPLKDQDIKKMNDATPSLLLVRFYTEENNGNASSVATEFVIGVKAKLVGCDSTEILRRITNDNTDGKFFINLMRTITGELKKRDFLFGLSRTYEDLESTKRKGSNGDLWALLKNRAYASKEAVRNGRMNNYSAITTVIISREDAEDLYREENLDITNVKVARHFMESYNLLGFVICDESTESLQVLFDDGSTVFDEISFTMLDRETQDGGTYKKLINLIASSR